MSVTWLYNNNTDVKYNSKCCKIFRQRTVSNSPAYFIQELVSKSTHDNILETNLTTCTLNEIVDEFWASFTYNGDNNTASQYVSSIIKCLNGASNIQYGPNSDNSVYTLTTSTGSWTKNRA